MMNWILSLGKDIHNTYKSISERNNYGLVSIDAIDDLTNDELITPQVGDRIIIIDNNRNPIPCKVLFSGELNEANVFFNSLINEENKNICKLYVQSFSNPEDSFAVIMEKEEIISIRTLFDYQMLINSYSNKTSEELEKTRKITISRIISNIFNFLQQKLTYSDYSDFDTKYWSEVIPNIYNGSFDMFAEYNQNYTKILGVSIVDNTSSRGKIILFFRRKDLNWKESLLSYTIKSVSTEKPMIFLYENEKEKLFQAHVFDRYGWKLSEVQTDGQKVLYVYN